MKIEKILRALSNAQRNCIRYPHWNRVGSNYFVWEDENTRAATINALVRMGLLMDARLSYRYWLTDTGMEVFRALNEQ